MTRRNIPAIILFCLLSIGLTAQTTPHDYDKSWKKVDSLISKKGLTQSALQGVTIIYTLAKKEKSDAQVIKALLYRMSLQEMNREDAAQKNIADLENEMKTAPDPAKAILLSIDAERYWNYFQQNRYKLYDRTNTTQFAKQDIATWGMDDFHKKISELYLASIKNEKLLQQTKLEPFDAIIIKGNVRHLRPTLYDLLTHRALDYFKNNERDINRPAYAFEINKAEAFSDKSVFAYYHFKTADSSSLQFKALQLFQQLLLFHAADAKPDALIDVDIERLEFVHQYSVLENNEELYTYALQNLTDRYGDQPAAAQAWYLQAVQYSAKASAYNPPKDTANRYAYMQAKAICEKVIQQKDSSEGKSSCLNLLQDIIGKEVSLQAEKVNVPDQPFRILVSYRNFSKLYFRLIKTDRGIKESLGDNSWQDKYWERLAQLNAVKTFSQSLPETNDYQKHAVEIKIDALPVGEYALLASVNDDFSMVKNTLAVQYFFVSNIAYISRGSDYFVLSRESGQPLVNAMTQVWNQYYNNKTGKYVLIKAENYQADAHGYFSLKQTNDDKRNAQLLEVSTATDHLFLDEQANSYQNNGSSDDAVEKSAYEKDNLKTFLFTDRSIYRPGQTVYFKGIVITKDFGSRQSRIIPGFKTKVILYDANNEKIDSLQLTTNDFGSYNGKFLLPENLLNGEFKITDDSSGNEQSFSVEEYKRPKFYVEYEKLKGSYRVNDTITITGSAKAYAGNAIDRASVKYRVVRQARFPYPWLYGSRGMSHSNEQEITHGEIKTNADGKFRIDFIAIPDHSIKKELAPEFEYRITSDITDINGETRSGETTVTVGYKALDIFINLSSGDNLPADSLNYLFIETKNLSGEFEPAKVNVTIYKLKSPGRLIKARYWPRPDQFVMSKEEYLKYFPNDECNDETEKETWEKTNKVFEESDSSKANSPFTIHHSPFVPGWYVIEVTAKDKYGEDVKNIKYVQLYDAKTGSPAAPQYNWAFNNYQIVEPGNKATINIGSSASDLFVIQQIERTLTVNAASIDNRPSDNYSFLILNNEKKSFEFPITEANRGGFGVFYVFIKNNRFYISGDTVSVPWTNKDLNISYETFRDKTLPGSKEKWKLKISGHKTEKVAAEILTAMYDASLDQFKPQGWDKPDIWGIFTRRMNWNSVASFSRVKSQNRYYPSSDFRYFNKVYDVINIGINGKYDGRPMYVYGNKMSSAFGEAAQRLSIAPSAVPHQEMNVLFKSNDIDKKAVSGVVVQDVQLEEINEKGKPAVIDNSTIQIRKNFNETAFFFPDLKTDSSGNVEFSFTMPEAVTQWKWMTLAHTKDLAFGYEEKSIITQKQLMVQPNTPRFLREGDHIDFSTKIVNLTDSELTGQVELQLIDATTNQPVDGWFQNMQANQYFTVAAKQSEVAAFPLQIPYQFNKPIIYRIVARAPLSARQKGTGVEVSDGEEATLPVLSNRMLVTESIPLNMPGGGTKNFVFEKLLQSGNSETLNHHSLTFEFTANPAWYAVQALPYLIEYPYECAEQTFNRYYANLLALKIVSSSPRIKEVFEKWKNADTAALVSNLEKNQELKSLLLQETPWVLEAKSESQQKRNIALLFDMARMAKESSALLAKLQDMQSPNGGFAWFKGGPDDRYITQYILTGIGHLKKLNALTPSSTEKIKAIVDIAIPYLDKKIAEDYKETMKQAELAQSRKPAPPAGDLAEIAVQYLYMRSFFSEYDIPGESFNAVNYYRKQSQQYWLQQNKFMQGMIALSLYRTGDIQKAKEILASLKQNAISNEELGIYWKEMNGGYYWYQAPIETQSLMIEAFQEIAKDTKTVNGLKTWLLKQKQAQSWETTKATADACYALLLQGTDWLAYTPQVQIKSGEKPLPVPVSGSSASGEAGTGYFKTTIDGPFVTPSMGNISITIPPSPLHKEATGPSWGAVYWQYFEDLDKITVASTPLHISKKLFVQRNTDRGLVLEPVAENGVLTVGDKVRVRIEIKTDRDMEYVHLKDMRASCMEPVNVLSAYTWQGGLGYYETTKDASTSFFFNWLPKGTYVFEYPLFVTVKGNFSNGVTTIQCMYAPEFTAHSEGIRVNVE